MSTAITNRNSSTAIQPLERDALEVRIALNSNLYGMQDADVWAYYRQMCEYLGIDAVSHPFDVITDQKQQTKKLYPNSICTAQLGEKRKYSYSEMRISVNDDLVKLGFKVAHVAVTVTAPNGRSLVSEAFVDLMSGWEGKPLAGNNLVNALKKAGTQCRRRGTLQMAGLAVPSDDIPTIKLGDIERAEGDADGVIIEHPPAAALQPPRTDYDYDMPTDNQIAGRFDVAEEAISPASRATQEEFLEIAKERGISSRDYAPFARRAAIGEITWERAIAELPK